MGLNCLGAEQPPVRQGTLCNFRMRLIIAQIPMQDTESESEGGPDGKRIKKYVVPDRRISSADEARRYGRKRSAKTFNGFKAHLALNLVSKRTRASR
jgi:hypothetical protein